MNLKNLISDLFGFTQDIYQLPETYQVKYRDIYAVSESQLANTKTNLETAEKKIIKLEKELELLAKQVTEVKPILPEQFIPATDTYKSGFRIYFKDKDGNDKNIYVSGKVSGTHLTLTPIFDNIIKESRIYTKDTELEVFNKILGWVQKNTSYCYDQNQWGKNQYENWTPAIIVYGTRQDDCVAEYEEIFTKNGVSKIKDLKVGDEVLSYNFDKKEYEYKPIVNMWDKGKLEINRVKFRNGSNTIDVSNKHPFLIADKYTSGENRYKTKEYIKTALCDVNLDDWSKRKTPIVKKIPYEIKDNNLSEGLCKVIGHYIAEGWKLTNPRYRVFTSGYDIIEEIIPILEEENIPFREFTNNSGVPCLEFKPGWFKDLLKNIKENSFNINLPEEYFHLPENKIRAIIEGYFIGDGHTDENSKWGKIRPNIKYRYSTSSEQWAKDLIRLHFQIGEPLYYWKQMNHQGTGKKPIYRLYYNQNSVYNRDFGFNDISEVSIASIETIEEKVQMYDFEVADNHNFVFKNGIISHNCESVAGLTISAFQYWQLLNNRKDTYPFIGVGLYAKSYGHGFPCLLTGADIENDLFIGEATLSVQRNAKPLKDCKNMYWCNWGAHSFWHEFRVKKDLEWWNESTATPINASMSTGFNNGSEKMTGNKIEEALVKDEKQFKKKKKLIEDFWE